MRRLLRHRSATYGYIFLGFTMLQNAKHLDFGVCRSEVLQYPPPPHRQRVSNKNLCANISMRRRRFDVGGIGGRFHAAAAVVPMGRRSHRMTRQQNQKQQSQQGGGDFGANSQPNMPDINERCRRMHERMELLNKRVGKDTVETQKLHQYRLASQKYPPCTLSTIWRRTFLSIQHLLCRCWLCMWGEMGNY